MIKNERRIIKKLQPRTQRILDLMRRFADDDGQMDYGRMNQEEPNWRAIFAKGEAPAQHFSRLRTSGLFKLHVNRTGETAAPMAPKISPDSLNDDEKLVMEISKKYRASDLGIDWKRATQEHPEWEQRFSYPSNPKGMVKGHHIASRLRKLGLVAPAGQPPTVVANPHPPVAGSRPLTEDQQFVFDLTKQYLVAGGRMSWLRVMQEHPEWQGRLNYGNAKNCQRGKKLLKELKALGLVAESGAQSEASKKGWAAKRQQEPATALNGPGPETLAAIERRIKQEVNKGVDAALAEMGFCPRCGNNLRAMFRAAAFAAKLGQ